MILRLASFSLQERWRAACGTYRGAAAVGKGVGSRRVVGRGTTDSAELYDPVTGKFTAIAKLTARRGEPRATMLANGDVLITGGDDHDGPSGHLASAEVFHAASLAFHATGAMHCRVAHTATLLNDGKVLIAGGKGETLPPSADLYDPKTGTFSETGSLVTARYKHTAGLLPVASADRWRLRRARLARESEECGGLRSGHGEVRTDIVNE